MLQLPARFPVQRCTGWLSLAVVGKQHTASGQQAEPHAVFQPWRLPRLCLPGWYAWFLLAGTLDLGFTYAVLASGGVEVNPIARAVLDWGGFRAMSIFKYLTVGLIIVICQYIYETRSAVAKRIVVGSTCVTFLPPVWAGFLLLRHGMAAA